MSSKTDEKKLDLTLIVYSEITLLGVVAASTWKDFLSYPYEVIGLAMGTVLSVFVAHVWAEICSDANRMSTVTFKHFVARNKHALTMFLPGIWISVCLLVLDWLGFSFNANVALTLLFLTFLLAGTSGWAAYQARPSATRALVFSAAGLAIGVIATILKITVGK